MDPMTMYLIATLGSSFISGLLGGGNGPQERHSFHGTSVDPEHILGGLQGYLNDLLPAALDRASQPVTLNTTVAPVPTMHGGGLPMPIGVYAQDPNRGNPILRTKSGVVTPLRRRVGGLPSPPPPNYPPPADTQVMDPTQGPPPEVGQWGGDQQGNMDQGGDYQQAAANVQLLLKAIGGGAQYAA